MSFEFPEAKKEASNKSVEEKLIRYFKENANTVVILDTPLLEHGVIDSMGVMELIAFIENTYELELDMDDLTIENFATINNIRNLISRKRDIL